MRHDPVILISIVFGFCLAPQVLPADDVPNGDYGAYNTWPEMLEKFEGLKKKHPDLIWRTSIGKTLEGRDIPAFRISDHADRDEDEPELLLQAGIHPREQPPQVLLPRLLEEMFDRYGSDPRITKLIDEREIWVIPVFNVDGKVYDMKHGNGTDHGAEWRKNRRPLPGGGHGIDLNRQFSVHWGATTDVELKAATTVNPKSDYYIGEGPMTEPETQALTKFLRERPLRLYVDIHSPFKAIFHPSFLLKPDHERYARMVRTMQSLQKTPYKATRTDRDTEPGARRAGDAGVSYDYGWYVAGVYSFIFEIWADPKWYPPPAQIDGEYANFRDPMLYLIEEAADLPLPKKGSAVFKEGAAGGKLSPGASVSWTPKVEGPCAYGVLVSGAPEIRVMSEYRLFPVKKGFGLQVMKDAKPGTEVPMTLYLWDRERGGTEAGFLLKIEP